MRPRLVTIETLLARTGLICPTCNQPVMLGAPYVRVVIEYDGEQFAVIQCGPCTGLSTGM